MERVQIEFTPQWDGEVKGYAVNYCTRQVWRTLPEYDVDDLLSEAYLVFMKLVDFYPAVDSPQNFMGLFTRALANKITNLANKRTTRRELSASRLQGEAGEALAELGGLEGLPEGPAGWAADLELRLLLEDVPEPLDKLVKVLVLPELDRAYENTLRPRYQYRGKRREPVARYLARIAGVDETKVDIVGMVKSWIKGEDLCIGS